MTNFLDQFEVEDCKIFLMLIRYVFKFVEAMFCGVSSRDEVTHPFLVS